MTKRNKKNTITNHAPPFEVVNVGAENVEKNDEKNSDLSDDPDNDLTNDPDENRSYPLNRKSMRERLE